MNNFRTPTTLPYDSDERKKVPLYRGLLGYFPAACAAVARHSMENNEKHNPGEPMHHARGKSTDHADCILRHVMDIGDLKAADARGEIVDLNALIAEHAALCWRALALTQEFFESLGAPLAPGARYPDTPAFSAEDAIRKMLGADLSDQDRDALKAAGPGEVLMPAEGAQLVGFDRGQVDTGTPGVELLPDTAEERLLGAVEREPDHLAD